MGTEQSVHRSRTAPLCDETMSIRLRNNYSPLHFHHVHGDNIKLSKSKKVAYRSEGFCNGIVFSDRPVMICEPIYVKFLETSPNWSGALRIGFTMNDPVSLKSKLPRYACPDLTSMHGNWAKAVGEKFAKKDSVLYYYVDNNGDVHYGIGAEEYGIFFGGVNTSGRLWAVLDIYGNTVAVEFMDPSQLSLECQNDYQNLSTNFQTGETSQMLQNMQSLSFHTVHGKNVTLKKNRSVVSKKAGCIHSLAYAFTENPVEINKTIIMIVQNTDNYFQNVFVYGITSCDPRRIDPHELPENVDDLLDRPEYWIVKEKKSCHPFEVGDTITLCVCSQGQVEVTINGVLEPVFYVDHTQPLWFFVNLSHSISELRLAGLFSNLRYAVENVSEVFSNLRITDSENSGTKVTGGTPGPSGQQSSNECVICYEEQVDCALYKCGHMCMCFSCASKLRSSCSTAQCPICRNIIQDVIKIYK